MMTLIFILIVFVLLFFFFQILQSYTPPKSNTLFLPVNCFLYLNVFNNSMHYCVTLNKRIYLGICSQIHGLLVVFRQQIRVCSILEQCFKHLVDNSYKRSWNTS